jgi:ATP-dependent DNA helicase RecQ
MLNLLKTRFGFDRFLPGQEEIIRGVVAGRDALVLRPTGGGKSLCYQLPALMLPGLTLVISPLIALMKDQVDALKANGIPAAFINSSLSLREIEQIQAEAARGQIKIIYAAPERLVLPEFQLFLQKAAVSLIAIDESHCISEWGHDFRPDYRNLIRLREMFPEVPAMALTATATAKVREDIIGQLALEKAQIFLSSCNRPNLTYAVRPKRGSYGQLLEILREHRQDAAIIYCFSRKDTEQLAADLRQEGLKALAYHAGLEGEARRSNQEKFIGDEVQIMVATIAFGMGIDKPDVRLVIHYHLPKSVEGYYQETGRAGRDGLPSRCILFYSYADKIKQQYFIRQIEDEGERQRAYQKLEQMVAYGELATCRRAYLLAYFGEDYAEEKCGGCDVCLEPEEEFEATIISQKIMSAILRTGEQFGINHVIEVLCGAKNQKILARGHDKLSVYGIVDDFSKDDLRGIINQLVARGLLVKRGEDFPVLELSRQGRDFLTKREQIYLPRLKARVQTAKPGGALDLEYDEELFEKLRHLRKGLAEDQGVPPFVVFGDVALRQMAAYLPQTAADFLKISGVGEAKLKQYGQIFTEVIQAYARENQRRGQDFPAGRAPRRPSHRGATYEETKKLVRKKMSIEEIAQVRGVSVARILRHIEKLLSAGEEMDLDYLRPAPEIFKQIEAAFEKSGGTSLTPVRERLGEEFSYEELRIARLLIKAEIL